MASRELDARGQGAPANASGSRIIDLLGPDEQPIAVAASLVQHQSGAISLQISRCDAQLLPMRYVARFRLSLMSQRPWRTAGGAAGANRSICGSVIKFAARLQPIRTQPTCLTVNSENPPFLTNPHLF